MRLLIVIAVAALTAIVATFVMKKIHGPWSDDSAIRTATVGALSAVVAMAVGRNLRNKD